MTNTFKIFFIFLLLFFNKITFALEITNYTVSYTGIFHNVTVALDNLDSTELVRCVIKKDSKPVAMQDAYVKGVRTIQIVINGGITNTSASCNIKR